MCIPCLGRYINKVLYCYKLIIYSWEEYHYNGKPYLYRDHQCQDAHGRASIMFGGMAELIVARNFKITSRTSFIKFYKNSTIPIILWTFCANYNCIAQLFNKCRFVALIDQLEKCLHLFEMTSCSKKWSLK